MNNDGRKANGSNEPQSTDLNSVLTNILLKCIEEPLSQQIEITLKKCLREEFGSIRAEPVLKTRKETAAILHITLPTLRSLEVTGKLLPCRIADKPVLYDLEDIKAYIKRSKEPNQGLQFKRGKVIPLQ